MDDKITRNPPGWRMSEQQQIVWDWAASHGLTLLGSECNDLLWKLEDWKWMDSAPLDRDIEVRAWIIPSEASQRLSGSKPFWDQCISHWSYCTWTNILGGKPDMWREIKNAALQQEGSAGE